MARILIVDDDPAIVEFLSASLAAMQHHVVGVLSEGEKILDALSENQPDLVLMDIVLSGAMDGIEAAKLCREHRTPVIFLTAYNDQEHLQRAKQAEPFAFLSKPCEINDLQSAIETAMVRADLEREIRDGRRLLKNTLSSIGDGVISTGLGLEIKFINEVAQQLLAIPVEEKETAILDHWVSFYDAEGQALDLKSLWGHLASQEVRGVSFSDISLKTAQQNQIPIDLNLTPLDNEKGDIFGVVLVLRDIRRQKSSEEEKEKLTERLRDVNEELKNVIYVTSHDLRAPVVNIQGFSTELQKAIAQLSQSIDEMTLPEKNRDLLVTHKQEVSECLHYIIKGTERIQNLLSGLLQVSRYGYTTLRPDNLDMNAILKQVKSSIQYQLESSDCLLKIGDLHPCWGDEGQITQVFANLIDNAVKYLEPSTPGLIEISSYRDQQSVVYRISDNGIGISPDNQNKIFNMFYQNDPKADGQGLGLNVVHRILDRHEGRIWLESEMNKGSTFFVSLPMAQGQPLPSQPKN